MVYLDMEVEEEKTSHFVQLDDGTYAEMVEGHEMVAPGHQMLVEVGDDLLAVSVTPLICFRIKMGRSLLL